MKYQLGNYVTERSKPGQILTVSEIDLKNMCVIEGYALNEETAKQARILPIEKVSPIPLDAEWLERFGFKETVLGNGLRQWVNKDCWIYLLDDFFEIELITGDDRFNFFRAYKKEVHVLQNLIASVTHTELTHTKKEI